MYPCPHPAPQCCHHRVPRGSGAPSSRLPEVSPGARRAGRSSQTPPHPAAQALKPSRGCNNAAGLSPRGRGAGSGAVGMQREWHRHSPTGPTPASVSPGWSSAWVACIGNCQGLLLLFLNQIFGDLPGSGDSSAPLGFNPPPPWIIGGAGLRKRFKLKTGNVGTGGGRGGRRSPAAPRGFGEP